MELFLLLVPILFIFIPTGGAGNTPKSEEERLLDHLFKNYHPSARPVIQSSETVNVKLSFSLLQIQDLNVRNQVLTTTGMLILEWQDERLTWDTEIFKLQEIVVDGRHIWKPEFAVINGAEGIMGDYSQFQAMLYPNGSLRWEPGGVFKTMCPIDITFYPFDEQKCDLTFGAWSYYTRKMNITTDSTEISMVKFELNGEWHVVDTDVVRREFSFLCCPDQRFSNVEFKIHLQRKHTFYILNVILPGILTSAVLLSIFFCTPGQKVHIGVAALLSFRLFLLNVADNIPRTSDHVPLLGVYLTSTMAITTLAMVATVFVLNLYQNCDRPVPPWARKLFIVYLSRLMCVCDCVTPKTETNTRTDPHMNHNHLHKDKVRFRIKYTPVPGRVESDQEDMVEILSVESQSPDFTRKRNISGGGSSSANCSLTGTPSHSASGHDSGPRSGKKPDYGKDWKRVAEVFDRLFFWICLIAILITTLLLFHPLTTSSLFPASS